jgi:hypothetical protein
MVNNNIYWDVFKASATFDWGETPFINEVEEVANLKGMASYLDDSNIGEKNRRAIQYEHCMASFSVKDDHTLLSKNKNILENSNEIVKRATKVLAGTYQSKPVRIYKDPKFEEVLENTAINDVMLKSDRVNTLLGGALIRVKQKESVPDFITYTPDNYRVKYDENGVPIELWIIDYVITKNKIIDVLMNIPQSTEIRYTIWNDTEIIKRNHKMEILSREPNSLGFMPFVFMTNKGSLKYDYKANTGGMYELVNAQIVSNELDFISRNSNRLSSLSIWHLNNFGELSKEDKDLNLGMTTAIATNTPFAREGDSPTIDVISADLTTDGQVEFKAQYVDRLLSNAGLPSMSINPDPTQNSGVARMVDREELNNYLTEQQYSLKAYDKELGDMVGRVLNAETLSNYNTEYAIDYTSAEFIDKTEQLTNDKMLLEMNIISVYEFAQRQGIDLPIDEIKLKLKENKLINDEVLNGTDEADNGSGSNESVESGNNASEDDE